MTALELFLVHSYLDDALDPAATEAFELLMMERPDLAELVDADSALRMGLAVDAGKQAPAPPMAQLRSVFPATQTRTRRRWPAIATAACVLVATGLSAGLMLRAPPPAQGAQLVYVDKTRSISAVPQVSVLASQALVLLVPVANATACVADIEIRQAGSRTLNSHATPDEFGYASLVLASGRLQLGRAEVSVRCGSGAPAEYAIDVVAATPDP